MILSGSFLILTVIGLLLVIIFAPANRSTIGYFIIVVIIFVLAKIFLVSLSRMKSKKHSNTQSLADVEAKGICFSFDKGLVSDSDKWDLMLNLPNGLSSNNVALDKDFKQDGIVYSGPRNFDDISAVPESDYTPLLEPHKTIEGHCYLVKTSTGEKLGKTHITHYTRELRYIKFRWQLSHDTQHFTKHGTI